MTKIVYVTIGQFKRGKFIMFTCNETRAEKFYLLWTCFDKSIQNK